ncbi:MAG: hypothetical protein Q7T71_03255 [Herbiconiux sp.]|nr:hypothetical protein [Herbiconiux sp.]
MNARTPLPVSIIAATVLIAGLTGCGSDPAGAPVTGTMTAAAASASPTPVETDITVPEIERDARFEALMTEWDIPVPDGVPIAGYSFIHGFDGQLRIADLMSYDSSEQEAKAWVDAVAAEWGVVAERQDGDGSWTAWLPGTGFVKAQNEGAGDDEVLFVYNPDVTDTPFTMPTDWDIPLPPDLGFTDARRSLTNYADTYEFMSAPLTARDGARGYVNGLVADGWSLDDERTATSGSARAEWSTTGDTVQVTYQELLAPGAAAVPAPSATTPTPARPECASILSADVAARIATLGWTAQELESPWQIGTVTVPNGVVCRWAADHDSGSHQTMTAGWGILTPTETDAAIASLLADDGDWRREDGDAGTYITSNSVLVADEDGYGETYLFADGRVVFAETRSALSAVTGPS